MKAGKLRAYRLGLWARARYAKLFEGKQCGSGFLKVASSEVERTINSAQLFLAGFYPPSQKDMWNKDIPWFPIAVYRITPKSDNVSDDKIISEKDFQVSLNDPPCRAILNIIKSIFNKT